MNRPPQPLTQAELLRRRCQSALRHHRQRARAEGRTLDYDLDDLLRLASATACAYCRRPVGFDLHFDHATPTGRPGGKPTLDNICVACGRCDMMKGILTAEEFALLLRLLAGLHPAAAEDLARRLIAGGKRYRPR